MTNFIQCAISLTTCEYINKGNLLKHAVLRGELMLFTFRYKLPIIFIIMNNNGIYRGLDKEAWKEVIQSEDLALRLIFCVCYIKHIC